MLRNGEMSVLEMQRAMLERLYYNQSKQENISSLPQENLAQFHNLISGNFINNLDMFGTEHNKGLFGGNVFTNINFQEMVHPSFSNSSITTVSPPPEKEIDQSTTIIAPSENVVSTKKRKAEFYEVQSEITEKSQRGEDSKENSKRSEVQKSDYIHVRARRGQATDSHSLAERARREKISKKMKYLQDIVPGCNKVTGKAGMLDEIINYVQCLQKQVEFLSMKLATQNPHLDNYFTKDFPTYNMTNFPTTVVVPTTSEYNLIQQQQGGSSGVVQMLPQRRENCLMPFQETSLASSPITVVQQQPIFEADLQSLFQCQQFN